MERLFIILLLSVAFANFASATPEAPEPVRDITGKILRTDIKYYILPAAPGIGGGLALASHHHHHVCPEEIIQHHHSFESGFPLLFTPVNPKKGVIRVSTDLNIEFAVLSKCHQSTFWKVDSYDEVSGRFLIGTGGIEGHPGANTINNWFKIEKLGQNVYKLVHCPSVCPQCKVICKNVGIVAHHGKLRLALSDVPLKVVFKKA